MLSFLNWAGDRGLASVSLRTFVFELELVFKAALICLRPIRPAGQLTARG